MGCLVCLETTGCEPLKSNLEDLYEFHITVEEADVHKFRDDCQSIGVKAILLDLHLKNGGVMKHLMTSSTFRGSYTDACIDIMAKAVALEKLGHKVIRQKIETTPLNPMVPSKERPGTSPALGQYFESHILIYKRSPAQQITIDWLCAFYDAHLSSNSFKKGERSGVMLTYREPNGTYEDFQACVDEIVIGLKLGGLEFERPIVEFTILDTHVLHDTEWFNHT